MMTSKKILMNLSMAAAAVLLMGSASAHASTTGAATPTPPEDICRGPDGNTMPDCPQGKKMTEESATLADWRRGPVIRRGYCFYHPRAPRCRI